MEPNARPKMSVVKLEKTPQFRRLTPKLQMWISTYLQSWIDLGTPDARLATQSAFETQGENGRTLSYKVLRNKKIQACLRAITNYGRHRRDIFLEEIEAEIAQTKPGSAARSRLVQTYAAIAFPKRGASIVSNANRKFNRSSALSPSVIAVISTEVAKVVPNAVNEFMRTSAYQKLADDQRTEAIERLANGITAGLAQFVESVKPELCSLE